MTKKKTIILETARTLFNKKGYQQVTIRMLALQLDMSSGNLNYHFKKREDIFEALYFEMVSEFDKRIENLTSTEVSIPQIRNDIKQSMTRMIAYQFFWTDLYNLLSISDTVKKHFQEVYQNRINGCFYLFQKLREQQLMKASQFRSEYKLLAERMINHGNTWLYSSRLNSKQLTEKEINQQVNAYLCMLYPYLTPQGQEQFKKLLPNLF
tara:strand:- start:10994 stop:11620 length:627 start_codon:yes stop_codon:yes gene_type:complete